MADRVRVLIVDDHERVRREVVTALRRAADVEVVAATGSAVEALHCVRGCEPDVVLLDVKREDGAGLELCRQLSRNTPCYAIVVFTSYLSPEEWSQAQEAGAIDYLFKQIDSRALVAKITQVAARCRSGRP